MGSRSPSSGAEIRVIGSLGRLPNGESLHSVVIQTPKCLRDVLSELRKRYGVELRRDSLLVLINGVEANALEDLDTVLNAEDIVVLIPMFHGGLEMTNEWVHQD